MSTEGYEAVDADVRTWPVLKIPAIPHYRKPQRIEHYVEYMGERQLAGVEYESPEWQIEMPGDFRLSRNNGPLMFECPDGVRFPGIVTEVSWRVGWPELPASVTVKDYSLSVTGWEE